MDNGSHILALIALDLLLLLGWISIPLGVGGNFLLLGAALVTAMVTHYTRVTWVALLVMLAAVAVGEIAEAVLGSLMARRYGATRRGMTGAFLGGIVGGILGTGILPLIGTLIGAALGTAAGTFLGEWSRRRDSSSSLKATKGAFLGRLLATGFKMAIGTGIVIYLVARTH